MCLQFGSGDFSWTHQNVNITYLVRVQVLIEYVENSE